MKQITWLFSTLLVCLLVLVGCDKKDSNVLKVGATPVPHAELLKLVKDDLKEKGIQLEVVEFTDYVTPNLALRDKQIDVNFFQHTPYLDRFNKERGLDLINFAGIHVEPMGLYSKTINHIDKLKNGSSIAIPNDSVNGGRALLLLQAKGLITLDKNAGLLATEKDIVTNRKNLKFKALEAAQLPRVLGDLDAAIINGNFAIEAGLNPVSDALVIEGAESPYVNILTIRKGEKEDKRYIELAKALKSDKVKSFILTKYNGGVVPAF